MLRTRLFLGLVPFVVLLLATGVYAIILFSRLVHRVDATVSGNYRSILVAQSMRLELTAIEREAWTSSTGTNAATPAFLQLQKQFEDNLTLLTNGMSQPAEQELTQKLTTNYAAFKRAMIVFNAAGGAENRQRTYQTGVTPSVLALDHTLEKIRDLNDRAILATRESIQQIMRDITRPMLIGMVVTLAIALYAYYRLSRSLLLPIESLTRATRELSQGNWHQPVPVESRDELGQLAIAFNTMAAQLQEYRQSTSAEIVRLHRTMETTLASFPDPIFVLNHKARIELKNPAADEFAAGLGLTERLPGELQRIAATALARGENFLPHTFDDVVSYHPPAGEKFYLPRVLVMRDKNNATFGVAVVLYDVTRFRLLDAAKTNLVATVSHELKTPLTSLRMALHILLEKTIGRINARQDEMLRGARDDAERLLNILNDLLDLARLEAGNAELRKEPVMPGELLEHVAREAADQAAGGRVRVHWSAESNLPAVHVDRQRISHVFGNLVNNAIKHSPAGADVRLQAASGEEGGVQFTVTDRGPGVPEEFQSRIFDRFFRVPGQDKTGAGLGLSIAREITVAHGGRIGVRSEPGQGSQFFVILPAANAAEAAAGSQLIDGPAGPG